MCVFVSSTQERLAVEEQLWLEEKEADILTPLLIRRDQSQPLSTVDAEQLHQDCLNEFKLRQAAHANLIQERYAKVQPLAILHTSHLLSGCQPNKLTDYSSDL